MSPLIGHIEFAQWFLLLIGQFEYTIGPSALIGYFEYIFEFQFISLSFLLRWRV